MCGDEGWLYVLTCREKEEKSNANQIQEIFDF